MAPMTAAAESFHKPPSQLLQFDPDAFERRGMNREARAQLQLRSASPEEWDALENSFEQFGVPKTQQRPTKAEQAVRREALNQELVNSRFGEWFVRTLLQFSQQDPSFRIKTKKEQYLAVFDVIGGAAVQQIITPIFPDAPEAEQGVILVRAYANFLEDQRLSPADDAALRRQGEAYLERFQKQIDQMTQTSKETGVLSHGEVDRSPMESKELEFASPFVSTTSFENADPESGEVRSESGTSGVTLAELEEREMRSGPRARTLRAISTAKMAKLPPSPRRKSVVST